MYYTGLDPFTGKKVYVARDKKEKAMQRALMHYRNRQTMSLYMRLWKRQEGSILWETPISA
jgi:hypothetical protein